MSCPAHALAASRRMLASEDVDIIRKVTAGLPSGSLVIDVGAGSGTTAISVFSERRDVQVVSIDSDEDTLNWARQAVKNVGAKRQWEGRVESGVDAAKRFKDQSLSFVVLDCFTTEEETKDLLEAWLPKVSFGGYIFIHDYDAKDAPNTYPGVKKGVAPFLERGDIEWASRQGWSLLVQRAVPQEKEKWSSEKEKEAVPEEGPKKSSKRRKKSA